MALDRELRDQAYQFFVAEAPELLQTLETGLLELRQDRSTAKIHSLMRAAHSLKGGAASVGLEAIMTLAHRLEDIFKALYSTEVEFDTELESQLLQAYDCLQQPLVEQIEQGSFDAPGALAVAEPVFVELETRLGDALARADDFIASSEDLGVDMVASIFEVDVEQGLEHLQAVLAAPENYQVAGEVRAQAEVFAGLAELMELPGFGAIAQATIAAIDAHPQQALEILALALADWRAAKQDFLAGDRTQGGNPSPALLALATNPAPAQEAAEFPCTDAALPSSDSRQSQATASYAPEPTQELADPMPSVEEIFAEAALTQETAAESSSPPSVEELFGNLAWENEEEDPLDPASEAIEGVLEENQALAEVPPPSLGAIVESISEIFERLPLAEDLSAAETLAAPDSQPPALPPAKFAHRPDPTQNSPASRPDPSASAPQAPAKASIRVELERLEQMDKQLSELAINRNRLAVQNDQLQQSVKELLNRFSHFQTLAGKLRELSDKLLVAQGLHSDRRLTRWGNDSEPAIAAQQADFDSLELDRYGALNALLQELLEETVQLGESVGDISLFAKQSDGSIRQQKKMLSQLRDELIWARMLPLGEILNRFPRILRDLSIRYSKPVHLQLSGSGVRVEKGALEQLYDPLLHLLRNAFDHGIEPPEVRRQQGKDETGKIEIRAYYQGSQTVIEVSDDGRGIDLAQIKQRAIALGAFAAEHVAQLPPERLYDLIFEPGFSTAQQVSELSGRGVGLDVVRSQIRRLKGTVTLTSTPGQGTTFTLRLPLTLSMTKLLICLVGPTTWAIPSDSIEEILIPKDNQLKQVGEQPFLYWQQQAIPIYRLSDLLDYNHPLPPHSPNFLRTLGAVPPPREWAAPLLLLRRGRQLFPIGVDQLVTEQELVIKPFGGILSPPSYIYGCTILGDGTVVPVIDSLALLDKAEKNSAPVRTTSSSHQSVDRPAFSRQVSQIPTLLVVDDSATQRQLLTLTFQRAGYRVLQAGDGREAIEELEQNPEIKLVVCDIEMPNMNGFEFLRYRRQYSTLAAVPVVMLTSRSREKHRRLAQHLGADDYFTKPYLEKEFLAAIERILTQTPPLNPSPLPTQ